MSPKNTHWHVHADSEDEAVARARADAEQAGLEVLRVGRIGMIRDHDHEGTGYYVTLSTQSPQPGQS